MTAVLHLACWCERLALRLAGWLAAERTPRERALDPDAARVLCLVREMQREIDALRPASAFHHENTRRYGALNEDGFQVAPTPRVPVGA